MQKGDIVTIMTPIGEYVGRFENQKNGDLFISDPRLIVSNPNEPGKIGFGRGVCMSAIENVDEVVFNDYLFVTPTNKTFESAWREATSGLVTV